MMTNHHQQELYPTASARRPSPDAYDPLAFMHQKQSLPTLPNSPYLTLMAGKCPIVAIILQPAHAHRRHKKEQKESSFIYEKLCIRMKCGRFMCPF
jgi:hypothetical protein